MTAISPVASTPVVPVATPAPVAAPAPTPDTPAVTTTAQQVPEPALYTAVASVSASNIRGTGVNTVV